MPRPQGGLDLFQRLPAALKLRFMVLAFAGCFYLDFHTALFALELVASLWFRHRIDLVRVGETVQQS